MRQESLVHSYVKPGQMKAIRNFDSKQYLQLKQLGIDVSRYGSRQYRNIIGAAMDSLQPTSTISSINTPIQFLQAWLPGMVLFQTNAMKIDMAAGLKIIGQFEDEEIVQTFLEQTGEPVPYNDLNNTNLSSYNVNYVTRTIVRFMDGIQIGELEQLRSARTGIDSGKEKRMAAAVSLNRSLNTIGFFGFNNGANRTYGLLNDPNLLAYITAGPKAGGGTTWAVATYLEIIKDINAMVAQLRTQSGDHVDPRTMDLLMVLPTNTIDYLSTPPEFGNSSVMQWIKDTYPGIEVESVPEFIFANGGENIAYLYAKNIQDGSTDDGEVVSQLVPMKFRFNGTSINENSAVTESYSMATAGVFLKRPIDLVRMTGI